MIRRQIFFSPLYQFISKCPNFFLYILHSCWIIRTNVFNLPTNKHTNGFNACITQKINSIKLIYLCIKYGMGGLTPLTCTFPCTMFTFNYFSLVCDGEALDRRKRERKKALIIEVGLITSAIERDY